VTRSSPAADPRSVSRLAAARALVAPPASRPLSAAARARAAPLLVGLLGAALLAPSAARSVDGTGFAPSGGDALAAAESSATYYEQTLSERAAKADSLDASGAYAGLPRRLHVVDAAGGVSYRADGSRGRVTLRLDERPHERVDAVYDLVLALPLPAGFATDAWRIEARRGSERASVPLVYGGETVALKRNVPLEGTWLPLLVGSDEGLPDLGSGWAWTLWDTVLRYDPTAGATVEGFARLDYEADASLGALDPEDPRNAAYLITWIPTLDAEVPPFAVRLDVVPPAKE